MVGTRLLIVAIFMGWASAAQAYSLTVVNEASQAAAALNMFPIDSDGEPIEDNIGGFIDPLPAGKSQTYAIDAQCGPTLAVVMMADDTELRLATNTCRHKRLVVRD